MIVLIAFLTFIASGASLQAQPPRTGEMETIFDLKDLEIGGFIGPKIKYTALNGEDALLVGGALGFILNHKFCVGLTGFGIVTEHDIDRYSPNDKVVMVNGDIDLRGGYGGLLIEYIIFPEKPVHFAINSTMGVGGLIYHADKWRYIDRPNPSDHGNLESSAIFIYEPSLKIEFNMLKFLRCGFSAGYRFVSGVDLPNTTNEDLTDFTVGFFVNAGIF